MGLYRFAASLFPETFAFLFPFLEAVVKCSMTYEENVVVSKKA